MPTSRNAIEQAVIQLLKPLEESHQCKVIAWPDGSVAGTQTERMLLVALSEEDWERFLTFDGDQEGSLTFDLKLLCRERRGDFGQLALRDAIDSLMAGDVAGFGPCEFKSAGFLGRDQSIWRFGLQYLLRVHKSEIGEG